MNCIANVNRSSLQRAPEQGVLFVVQKLLYALYAPINAFFQDSTYS